MDRFIFFKVRFYNLVCFLPKFLYFNKSIKGLKYHQLFIFGIDFDYRLIVD